MIGIVLFFCLCSTSAHCEYHCDEGELRAATCEIAEAYLRAGLRPRQHLIVYRCERDWR